MPCSRKRSALTVEKADKVKTVVKIAGKEYLMASYESEEYMHRVAIYVDRKIQQLEKSYVNLSTSMVAVLASLNIADELLKLQDKISEFEESRRTLIEEVRVLQRENMALREGKKPGISSIQDAKKLYDGIK